MGKYSCFRLRMIIFTLKATIKDYFIVNGTFLLQLFSLLCFDYRICFDYMMKPIRNHIKYNVASFLLKPIKTLLHFYPVISNG